MNGLFILTALFLPGWHTVFAQETQQTEDYLLLIEGVSGKGGYAYLDIPGDTIIPAGSYAICYTDTFRHYAIVMTKESRMVAIDRNQEILFEVYPYDNGPDYPSEGLFRILEDGKIGYANLEGEIVIRPKYACAYPFKDGKARVSYACQQVMDGEHTRWESSNWFLIDRRGKRITGKD